MSEANTRHTVVDHFRRLGADCQRIEDAYSVGIPDLNLCYHGVEGWLEFKYVATLPKRAETPVRIGLKSEQALWLATRARHGGRVGVLTKIEPGRIWLLHYQWSKPGLPPVKNDFLEGACLATWQRLRDGLPLTQLCTTAGLYWTGHFHHMAGEVLKALLFGNTEKRT